MNTVTLGGTATINDLVSVARFGAKVAFSKEAVQARCIFMIGCSIFFSNS